MTNNNGARWRRFIDSGWAAGVVFAAAVLPFARARGQEAIRPSLAGAEVAADRIRIISQQPYNLRLGFVDFRFGADLHAEYNDNIAIAEKNRQADFLLEPHIDLEGVWRITSLNLFRFNLGLGFDKYLVHSRYDSGEPLISPGSEIAFDIFVAGNVRITFHERFDLAQNPIDEPALSNVVAFRRFENTAGFNAVWDLNKLTFTSGYAHFNYVSLGREFEDLTRHADTVSTSACWSFNETTRAGLNLDATYTAYNSSFHDDSTTINGGPFTEIGFSPYFKVRLGAGYQGIHFGRAGSINDGSSLDDWYGNFAAVHRFNRFFTETLAAGHESELGLTSNYEKLNFVRYTADIRFLKAFTTKVDAFFEDIKESGGALPDHLQRYGFGVSFACQLTRSVRMTTGYNFLDKQSKVPGLSYEQDRLYLDLAYQF